MITRPNRALAAVASLTALVLAACGGADGPAPKSASPPMQPAPEPRTVEEAQEQIARLSAELGGSSEATKSDAKAEPKPESRPQPAPPAAESTGTGVSAPAAGKDHDQLRFDACASPCRALASMRRAVDALCRMTGDTDNRCVDAKKTLADSLGRTASCKCG